MCGIVLCSVWRSEPLRGRLCVDIKNWPYHFFGPNIGNLIAFRHVHEVSQRARGYAKAHLSRQQFGVLTFPFVAVIDVHERAACLNTIHGKWH